MYSELYKKESKTASILQSNLLTFATSTYFTMRFAAISALALPIFAAASAIPRNNDQCSGGDIQCCNSTQTVNAVSLPILGGLLGLVLPAVTGLVGLTCSPLSVLALAGQSCTKQQVCCTDNSFNGVIALGCIAINL